ncbi:Glutamate synthase [Pseudozyma hubeiensis]|nr:Glutamate synthase [Pseudozyma hubeiensis]
MRVALSTASFALLAAAATYTSASPLKKRQDFQPAAFDTWVWQDVSGTQCADGSSTGVAYNAHADYNTRELLIWFDSGGACRDANTCFYNPTAWNLNGYTNYTFQNYARPALESQILMTTRDPSRNNPWANSHMLFVPYCTGDIHGGNNIITYPGAPRPIYHKGYTNFQSIVAQASSMIPWIETVYVAGSSAGCYGAVLNYVAVRQAWPSATVHLIADSCEGVPGFLDATPSWNLFQPSGSSCPDCVQGQFNSILPALAQANPRSRFAAISYSVDDFLPYYMGTSLSDFAALIKQYFINITNTAGNMAKTFTVSGQAHGVFIRDTPGSSTDIALAAWLASMKNLGSNFTSQSV